MAKKLKRNRKKGIDSNESKFKLVIKSRKNATEGLCGWD